MRHIHFPADRIQQRPGTNPVQTINLSHFLETTVVSINWRPGRTYTKQQMKTAQILPTTSYRADYTIFTHELKAYL